MLLLVSELLQLNYGTSSLDSLLQVLSLFLAQTFLNGSGSTVYEILSFLQTKAASFLNSLNYLQLVCTSLLQNYIERRLLLSCLSSTGCSRTSSYSNGCSSGLNSVLVLQDCCYSSFRTVANSLTSFTVRFTNSSAIALISAILFKNFNCF